MNQTPDTQASRILMCDDDVFILRAAELKLRNAGYELEFAHDGEEAWSILCSGETTFAALITDRQMPRMDGLELIQRVRSADREDIRRLPIILLTSRAHDLPEEFDVDVMVDKPFSPRNLVKEVQTLVGRAEATAVTLTEGESSHSSRN